MGCPREMWVVVAVVVVVVVVVSGSVCRGWRGGKRRGRATFINGGDIKPSADQVVGIYGVHES